MIPKLASSRYGFKRKPKQEIQSSSMLVQIAISISSQKKSIHSHNCLPSNQNSKQIIDNSSLRYQNALKHLYIWISKKNISFNSLYDIGFRGFLYCLNNEFEIPPETTLRKNIKNIAHYIENKIFEKIANKPVSLLLDGVTRNKQKFQGMVIYTPEQLYYIGLEPCDNSTSEVIASIISKVALKIKEAGSKLIAVCTDNAKNNIAALDFRPLSAQVMSSQSFIRFPCACHTVNLVVKDIFSEKYNDILNAVIKIITFFNDKSKSDKTLGKIPQFKEVRWFSLSKCVLFILLHINALDEDNKNTYIIIQEKYNWVYISHVLQSIKLLIKKLEKDAASIADIYVNLDFTLNELKQLSFLFQKPQETNLAFDLVQTLVRRFSTTVEMKLPFLSFFLTGYGINSLKSLTYDKIIIMNIARKTLFEYLNDHKEKEKLCLFFEMLLNNYHLTFLQFCHTTSQSFEFWKKISIGYTFWSIEPLYVQQNSTEFKRIQIEFSKVAIEILTIPCSECACERVFSHLSDILMNNKRNFSFSMLNSLMMIRVNSIFLRQQGQYSDHFIKNDLKRYCKKDYDKIDASFENDPLVFF